MHLIDKVNERMVTKQQENKYLWAIVNDVKRKTVNFKVKPLSLFIGYGGHPKVILISK